MTAPDARSVACPMAAAAPVQDRSVDDHRVAAVRQEGAFLFSNGRSLSISTPIQSSEGPANVVAIGALVMGPQNWRKTTDASSRDLPRESANRTASSTAAS